MDYSRVWHPSSSSPYAVGIRYAKLTEKNLETNVFYPIDQESVKGKDYTAKWSPDGDRVIRSF